jgi:diguanylate cyclase (GGDEF)-like protein/PAS domain S-box-containing protein
MKKIPSDKLLDYLFDGVYYVDIEKSITYWNKAAEEITGYSKADMITHCCADNLLRHISLDGKEMCTHGCPLTKTLRDGKKRASTVYLHHKNGHRILVSIRISPVRDDTGMIIGAAEIFSHNSNNTQLVKDVEIMRKLAYRDTLTSVGNRRYFELVFESRHYDQVRIGIPLGIIFFDIDRFKYVNDKFGHETGDKVLVMVTQTVSNILRRVDYLFRWGGEEFIILLPQTSKAKLTEIAERVRFFIEKSFIAIGDKILSVTVSLGASMVKEEDTGASCVKRADELMFKSKKRGRNLTTID